jgi:hypothetical protein
MSTTQVNDNELRELSFVEQAEVSGGLTACYKNVVSNPYRYVAQAIGNYTLQQWKSGQGYVNYSSTVSGKSFDVFCRDKGYPHIFTR